MDPQAAGNNAEQESRPVQARAVAVLVAGPWGSHASAAACA